MATAPRCLPTGDVDPDVNPDANPSLVERTFGYSDNLLMIMNELRLRSVYTDAVLCCGSDEFPCHRIVLAASSTYFDAMFSSQLRESRETRVVLHGISTATLRRLLDYVYTGRIEIDHNSAQDLLSIASLYAYPAIVSACCRFLVASLHPSNCLGIEAFATHLGCDALSVDAHRYILENFASVTETEEYCELSITRLMSYIASDLIEIQDEEFLWHAVLRWIDADKEHRSADACALIAHLRFQYMCQDFVEKEVVSHNLIARCPSCSNLVARARRCRQVNNSIDSGTPSDLADDLSLCGISQEVVRRPATIPKEVMVMIGGSGGSSGKTILQSMESFDPRKNRWTSLPNLPNPVSYFSATAVGNDIFVIGGEVNYGVHNRLVADVWRFLSAKRCWERAPSLITPRSCHASAVWDTRLYVIGGINAINTTDDDRETGAEESIECLDLVSPNPAWIVVAKTPSPRLFSQVMAYSTSLVEIGGTVNRFPSKRMECYQCNLAGFTYSGEQYVLPDEIRYSKFVLLDGCFLIVWENTLKVISLNPTRRTFKRVKDMPNLHSFSGATVLNKRLYIGGGYTGADHDSPLTNAVECYDPETDTWESSIPMSESRAHHGCVTICMS